MMASILLIALLPAPLALGDALEVTNTPAISVEAPVFGGGGGILLAAESESFRASATKLLGEAGLRVADGPQRSDYRVTPLVRRFLVRYDAPYAAEVAVEWQVSERTSGRVIYSVVTRGYVEGVEPDTRALGTAAFADAAIRLAARPKLRSALTQAPVGPNKLAIRACSRAPMKLPADLANTFDAVVTVADRGAFGSGAVISPDGFVLTAAHLVPEGTTVEIITHGGTRLPAQVVRRSQQQDVALLHVANLSSACLSLLPKTAAVGDDLFVIGTPAGLDYSVSKGIVSGIRMLDGVSFLQTDASISPGNSGGPMMDVSGRVIAIVSWKIRAAGFEGLGFGVPSQIIVDQLGLSFGDQSDGNWSSLGKEPAPTVVEDTPDESRFEVAGVVIAREKARRKTRRAGVAAVCLGGLVASTSAWYAANLDHASDPLWTALELGNSAGWIAVLGGGAAMGLSYVPVSAQGFEMSVGGRF